MDEVRKMVEELKRENDRLKGELGKKDRLVSELMEEKQDRNKRHLQEIENLKLSHQQEIYMLKRLQK